MIDGMPETDELKKASLEGSSGKRTDRRISMKMSDYKRTLKALAAAVAISASIVIGGGAAAYNYLQNNAYVNNMTFQFRKEIISPETHRTDNNKYYFYDYMDIAKKIKESDDFDLGVYLFFRATDETQTDRVLAYTEYKDLHSYITVRGWKDADEWKKEMRKYIVLTGQIAEKKEELDNMQKDRATMIEPTEDTTNYGGK